MISLQPFVYLVLGGYIALIVSSLYRVNIPRRYFNVMDLVSAFVFAVVLYKVNQSNLPANKTSGVSSYFILALSLLAFIGLTRGNNKNMRMVYYSVIVGGIITPLFSGPWHTGNFSIL